MAKALKSDSKPTAPTPSLSDACALLLTSHAELGRVVLAMETAVDRTLAAYPAQPVIDPTMPRYDVAQLRIAAQRLKTFHDDAARLILAVETAAGTPT